MLRMRLICDECGKILNEPPWLSFVSEGFVRTEARRVGWTRKKDNFGLKRDLCKECSTQRKEQDHGKGS